MSVWSTAAVKSWALALWKSDAAFAAFTLPEDLLGAIEGEWLAEATISDIRDVIMSHINEVKHRDFVSKTFWMRKQTAKSRFAGQGQPAALTSSASANGSSNNSGSGSSSSSSSSSAPSPSASSSPPPDPADEFFLRTRDLLFNHLLQLRGPLEDLLAKFPSTYVIPNLATQSFKQHINVCNIQKCMQFHGYMDQCHQLYGTPGFKPSRSLPCSQWRSLINAGKSNASGHSILAMEVARCFAVDLTLKYNDPSGVTRWSTMSDPTFLLSVLMMCKPLVLQFPSLNVANSALVKALLASVPPQSALAVELGHMHLPWQCSVLSLLKLTRNHLSHRRCDDILSEGFFQRVSSMVETVIVAILPTYAGMDHLRQARVIKLSEAERVMLANLQNERAMADSAAAHSQLNTQQELLTDKMGNALSSLQDMQRASQTQGSKYKVLASANACKKLRQALESDRALPLLLLSGVGDTAKSDVADLAGQLGHFAGSTLWGWVVDLELRPSDSINVFHIAKETRNGLTLQPARDFCMQNSTPDHSWYPPIDFPTRKTTWARFNGVGADGVVPAQFPPSASTAGTVSWLTRCQHDFEAWCAAWKAHLAGQAGNAVHCTEIVAILCSNQDAWVLVAFLWCLERLKDVHPPMGVSDMRVHVLTVKGTIPAAALDPFANDVWNRFGCEITIIDRAQLRLITPRASVMGGLSGSKLGSKLDDAYSLPQRTSDVTQWVGVDAHKVPEWSAFFRPLFRSMYEQGDGESASSVAAAAPSVAASAAAPAAAEDHDASDDGEEMANTLSFEQLSDKALAGYCQDERIKLRNASQKELRKRTFLRGGELPMPEGLQEEWDCARSICMMQNNDPKSGFTTQQFVQKAITAAKQHYDDQLDMQRCFIFHTNGSGGSVVCRRIAYELGRTLPTVLVDHIPSNWVSFEQELKSFLSATDLCQLPVCIAVDVNESDGEKVRNAIKKIKDMTQLGRAFVFGTARCLSDKKCLEEIKKLNTGSVAQDARCLLGIHVPSELSKQEQTQFRAAYHSRLEGAPEYRLTRPFMWRLFAMAFSMGPDSKKQIELVVQQQLDLLQQEPKAVLCLLVIAFTQHFSAAHVSLPPVLLTPILDPTRPDNQWAAIDLLGWDRWSHPSTQWAMCQLLVRPHGTSDVNTVRLPLANMTEYVLRSLLTTCAVHLNGLHPQSQSPEPRSLEFQLLLGRHWADMAVNQHMDPQVGLLQLDSADFDRECRSDQQLFATRHPEIPDVHVTLHEQEVPAAFKAQLTADDAVIRAELAATHASAGCGFVFHYLRILAGALKYSSQPQHSRAVFQLCESVFQVRSDRDRDNSNPLSARKPGHKWSWKRRLAPFWVFMLEWMSKPKQLPMEVAQLRRHLLFVAAKLRHMLGLYPLLSKSEDRVSSSKGTGAGNKGANSKSSSSKGGSSNSAAVSVAHKSSASQSRSGQTYRCTAHVPNTPFLHKDTWWEVYFRVEFFSVLACGQQSAERVLQGARDAMVTFMQEETWSERASFFGSMGFLIVDALDAAASQSAPSSSVRGRCAEPVEAAGPTYSVPCPAASALQLCLSHVRDDVRAHVAP
jgi:hypothetical protein